MNKYSIGIIAILILIASLFSLLNNKAEDTTVSDEAEVTENVLQRFTNVGLGLSFDYRGGADGYTLIEPEPAEATPTLLKTIMLVHADDMPMIENPPVGGEGPPTISIYVYENLKNEWSAQWATSHAPLSNIGLAFGEPTETVIGGANAIRYRADGLYPSEVVVVAHGGFVYVLSAAFRDEQSPQLTDFESLLNSVTFIPTTSNE